ncbi:MAG: type IV secretory system conjugative DNA transfer family protein [Pseudomonadota bacterium]
MTDIDPDKKPISPGPIEGRFPEHITSDGLLVGWMLEEEHRRASYGFKFGDEETRKDDGLIDPILFGDEGHLITIAATGAGKGIGCIIPALLRHKGPMIVIDPKGENAAVTKRHREEMGQKVFVLDPMGIVEEKSARFNPLDAIDPTDREAVDEASAMADLLSSHLKVDLRNRYWHNRGCHLVTSLILHCINSPDKTERTLAAVRGHLNRTGDDDGQYLFNLLKGSDHPEARRAAGAFRGLHAETISAIASSSQDMVDFIRGDPVREMTSASDFTMQDITDGKPITIYIVLPPHMLESHAQLLRLWVGAILKAIMRRRHRPELSTIFLLDEAAQLGSFAPLRQAITLLRGYGLQTWSFWQDTSQLVNAFPTTWRTLINNCRVVQAFGAPNMSAAQSIANLFEIRRAETILDMEHDEMLVQISGDDAFVARRPNYLRDPVFAGQFDPNPFYQSAKLTLATAEPNPVKRKETAYLRDKDDRSDGEIIEDLLKRYG